MSTLAEAQYLAGKDAATKEREDRLNNARKKLKNYRARQSKNSSSVSSTDSHASSSRRLSTASTSNSETSGVANHAHRRSMSRSGLGGNNIPPPPGAAHGHGRKASKSKASRSGSISQLLGHGHTRSRASVSISVSAPPFTTSFDPASTTIDDSFATTPTSASWNNGASSPARTASPGFPSSSSLNQFDFSSGSGTTSTHARRASRHNRRSSVSNFRESLEIVSGQGNYQGNLQTATSSFAPPVDMAPTSPSMSAGGHSPTWSNDPAKVLEALKERGRRESETEDPMRTRLGALEALEGRLAAPSEMIDLGNQTEGSLLVAPPSPGFTGGAFAPSASPTSPFSLMVGLGLGGAKRNSWTMPGPVTAAGAKGAMDLGMLVEEEEGEGEEEDAVAALPESAKKMRSPPRKRPTSLLLAPSPEQNSIAVSSPGGETPLTGSFAARPMRLSLSLSSTASSFGGTPSTAASTGPSERPPVLRSLTLGATPSAALHSPDADSPGERRRHSLFHAAAVASANFSAGTGPTFAHSPTPPPVSRGLRSLSIGSNFAASPSPSPSSDIANRMRSPILGRRTASTSGGYSSALPRQAGATRSSISYNTSSASSLASPEGPLSAAAQAARRPWRPSMSTASVSSTSSSPASVHASATTAGGFSFPFAPSHGTFGGFGDLEVEDDEEEPASPTPHPDHFQSTSPSNHVLLQQITSLRTQIDNLHEQSAQQSTMRTLEVAEFEKKAGEEARAMRMRLSELERQLEEARVGRRFEVEGLSREVEQARDAMADLTDERDSLREDVDGWRARCASLEAVAKKEREDAGMAKAQAKLIGEMRDQIYNLVAALERERAEHEAARQEVEQLLVERGGSPPEDDKEAAAGSRGDTSRRHSSMATSEASAFSSSFGQSFSGNNTEDTSATTDLEDAVSKSSPSSGHSSFGFPSGSKGRESDFGSAAGLGGLHTLAEEEEEEEEQEEESPVLKGREDDRVRLGSGSTGSTSNSEVMPMTPNKDQPAHNRSDSFVRHWSFPKGSVSSVRISSDDDHSFFDLNRHTSLPALPIPESILPPFLCADLTVDEDQYAVYAPQHVRRPSSPRPLERLRPHSRRFSGQYAAKAPPISPSALAHAALQSSASSISSAAGSFSLGRDSPTRLARLSFGNLMGSLGSWSSVASASASAIGNAGAGISRLSLSRHEEREDEEETIFMSSASPQHTPPSLSHSSHPKPQRRIKASSQPVPRASPLSRLDFRPVCCSDSEKTFVV